MVQTALFRKKSKGSIELSDSAISAGAGNSVRIDFYISKLHYRILAMFFPFISRYGNNSSKGLPISVQ